MSHNNKYYLKRLKSNNASTKPINTFFKSTTVRDDGSLEPTTSSSTLEPTTSTSLPEPTTSSSTPEPTTSTSLPESTTSSSTTSPSRSDSSLCGSKSSSKSNCDPSTSNNDDNKAPKPTQELGPKNTLATKYELHYEWLFFSFSKKGYCCKHCQVFFTDNSSNRSPFIFGTELGDHPIRKLESHQQSKAHQEAVAKNHSHSAVSSGSQQTIDSLVRKRETLKLETHRKYIGSLINTTYFVIKKQWALDSVHDVMYHLKRENCPNIEQYENLYPQFMYTSSSSVSDIVCAIDQMVEKDILDKIRMAKYIALLADESTDEANRAQFAILIRCFVGNKIDDHFVGIVNVIRTTAESLMDAIQEFLQSKGIDISKVLFNGFDGCNTMSGQNKGLQKRFRHVVPHCLYINCRSHRLALAVKHLMKFFPVLVSVDEALLSIYHLFDNSPQRFGVFKDVQESYAIRELVLVRAAATRWLSHGQACKRVIDRFVQIVDTLDELIERKREPEVIGIRDAITNKTTLFAIIVLCDLLDPVNFFCKYLQGSVDFSMVTIKLKDLIDTLHNLTEQFRATVNNTNVPLYMSRTAQLFEEVDERTVYTRRLRNVGVHTHHQMVEEVAVPMVLKLIAELEDAFRPSPVLAAFSIFNLSHLPETMVELIDYGNHEIRTLSSHYGEVQGDDFEGHRSQSPALFNKDAAIAEFSAFKPQMLMMKQRGEDDPLHYMMRDDILRRTFPTMFDLLMLSRLIPTSTASVERVFSLMNNLCTNHRSSLKQETLSSLMRICSDGPEYLDEEQLQQIIDNFKNIRPRAIDL